MLVGIAFIITGIVMLFFIPPLGIGLIILGVIGFIWGILKGTGKGIAWLFGKSDKD